MLLIDFLIMFVLCKYNFTHVIDIAP